MVVVRCCGNRLFRWGTACSITARTAAAGGARAESSKQPETKKNQHGNDNEANYNMLHDQAGSTKMLAAVSSSKLRVPPLTFTIHCRRRRPCPGQSSSITEPGSTPKLAILPQTTRSPLIRQTLTVLHVQHSESGRAAPPSTLGCIQPLLLPNRQWNIRSLPVLLGEFPCKAYEISAQCK